jgi:photosystem II stability/assembly factor-like uncharacterized protein
MRPTAPTRALLAGILFLFAASLHSEWNWQSPVPQGNTLISTQFIDAFHGWAVGEYGTALHTIDGGVSWYEQEFGRTDNLLALSMVSDTEGWCVGDNGVILHTTDAGDDWLEQSSGIGGGLNSVVFLDALNGWAAGDNETILHTSNGGLTWITQHQNPNPTAVLNSIAFVNFNKGWAVGSARRVYRTNDGGASWLPVVVGSGLPASYLSVAFVDSMLGFVAGTGGELFRTTDGGTGWSQVSTGDAQNLNQILMQNSFVGWIAGDSSKILRTINGGLSWSTVVIGDGFDYNGLTRFGGDLRAVGGNGSIIQSTNGGSSWVPLDHGSRLSANWIDTPTGSTGIAVGQTGLILRTTDAGSTWAGQVSPVPSVSCYGVRFIDANHGWAVGDNGTIIRTVDGTNWAVQASGVTHSLFGISFGNSSSGWIVGGEGTNLTGVILNSTDGGASWHTQLNGVPHILYGASFPNALTGWAVGELGYVLHTTNGGANWSQQTSGTTHALFWCSFLNQNNGWAVGDSGEVIHTTNGGATWQQQSSGVPFPLFSMAHISSLEAYIAGDQGSVLRTTDAGGHWDLEYTRTLSSLFGMATPGAGMIWACGDNGTILANTINASPGIVGGAVYYDLNSNGHQEVNEPGTGGWKVVLHGPSSDSMLTLDDGSFSFQNLPFGTYTLSETPSPSWTQTEPAPPGSYTFTLAPDSAAFSGSFGNYTPGGFPCTVAQGWNVLSLPILPSDPRKNVVYPTAISPAFAYDGSYVLPETLSWGTGFWLRFSYPQTVWIAGAPVHDDTIGVARGWNLIGMISDTVSATGVPTDPLDMVISRFFQYDNGYQPASVLGPARGYWVKASEAGNIIFNPRPLARGGRPAPPDTSGAFESLNSLTITDRRANHETLYFGTAAALPPGDPSLPPLPPDGCFDARFSGDRDAVVFSDAQPLASPASIFVRSAVLPLTVSWKLVSAHQATYEFLEGGTLRHLAWISAIAGSISLQSLPSGSLVLKPFMQGAPPGIPASFSLEQNMPNPFNPTTLIRYSIPADLNGSLSAASPVRLKIYDLLGREVATLVNEPQAPGAYTVEWDASGFPTGVYVYRLSAGSNEAVKKMILLR